ncbi:uncharacterized protein LOC135099436 isoform X2 [Scylla paramamosain]|uniref:uncharacterized protein LOC135099436 isoform X2 n=1 Tax=Scylla paramamosain TaxID=85552 RepID=UPI003083D367
MRRGSDEGMLAFVMHCGDDCGGDKNILVLIMALLWKSVVITGTRRSPRVSAITARVMDVKQREAALDGFRSLGPVSRVCISCCSEGHARVLLMARECLPVCSKHRSFPPTMVIIPFVEKHAREVAWDGEEHGRHRARLQAGVVFAVEWAAVLLGLLPLGWREVRWSLPRKIVALTASGITFALNFAFAFIYLGKFTVFIFIIMFVCLDKNIHTRTHILYAHVEKWKLTSSSLLSELYIQVVAEQMNLMMYILCVLMYAFLLLLPLIMLLFMWVKCSSITRLLAVIRDDMLPDARKKCSLYPILIFLYGFVEYLTCCLYRYNWFGDVPFISTVFAMAVWYIVLSLSFICTFPLLLALTGGYVLRAALKHTNDELQQLTSQPPVAAMQQAFRVLRGRYVCLRRFHQQMADLLSFPILIWSLEKLLVIIFGVFYVIDNYKKMDLYMKISVISLVLGYVMSLYVFTSFADHITLQGAAPKSILLDADVANEPEKTDPDVEAQVARLLKVCQRPLVICPFGLFTVSRSNLLAILLTVSTYAVVLLQFNAENLGSGTLPLPGNCSCPCPDGSLH